MPASAFDGATPRARHAAPHSLGFMLIALLLTTGFGHGQGLSMTDNTGVWGDPGGWAPLCTPTNVIRVDYAPGINWHATLVWGGAAAGTPPTTVSYNPGFPVWVTVSTPIVTSAPVTATLYDDNGNFLASGTYAPPGGSAPGFAAPSLMSHLSGDTCIAPGGSASLQVDLHNGHPSIPPFSSTPSSYSWVIDWSDGVQEWVSLPTSSATHTRVVSPSVTTTYTVVAQGDSVCVPIDTGSATVSIAGASGATASAILNTGAQLCLGGATLLEVTLGSTTAPQTPPYTWDLTWSDGLTETVTSPTQPIRHLRTVGPSRTTTYAISSVDDRCGTPTPGIGAITVYASAVTISSITSGGGQISINGSGFQPPTAQSVTVTIGQQVVPATVHSDSLITAPHGPLGIVGGTPVQVEVVTACSAPRSNTAAFIWNPLLENRGTIVNRTAAGGGGPISMTFHVEGGEPNSPVSIMADLSTPPVRVFGNQFLQTWSGLMFPIVDGLQVLGFWGMAPVVYLDGSGSYAIEVTVPASLSGLTFNLQAAYADPSSTVGITLTWPLAAFVP